MIMIMRNRCDILYIEFSQLVFKVWYNHVGSVLNKGAGQAQLSHPMMTVP